MNISNVYQGNIDLNMSELLVCILGVLEIGTGSGKELLYYDSVRLASSQI